MILLSASPLPAKYRTLWFFAFGVAILASIGGFLWFRQRSPVNVILVTFDTTRADRLGVYGYKKGLTEAFDEFARRGVVFEHAYAPAPITLPSHATMLTGLYPPEHDLRMNGSGKLSKEIPFLPQILKEHGFDTGAFIAAPAVLGSQFGLDRGFDTYDDAMPKQPGRPGHLGEPRRDGKEVVDLALAWMQKRTDKPFFCWIHLYDAHAPYDPRTDAYQQRFIDDPYDAGVAWQLQQFQRVTSYLKERQLESNTLVVVAGDHGEGLDEHQETEHGMLVYDTTMHIPFIFVGTDQCQPGTRVSSTVSLVDLAPTVLDLLQVPKPKNISGRSLLEGLKGRPIESRECYGEAETPFTLNRWSPLRMVISDRWKFIQTTRPELYDLAKDPGELTNLIESEVSQRQSMEELLAEIQGSFTLATAAPANLSEKELANLKSLGYVASSKSVGKGDDVKPNEILVDIKDMLPQLAKFEEAKHMGLEGKVEESIVLLQEIVQSTDKFPAAELLLGDCQAQSGRFAEAAKTYRALLARQPDFVRAHFTLGRVLAGQGLLEEAVVEFREFLKSTPDAATTRFELAQVLTQLKKLDDAAAELQRAIELAPDLGVARIALGQLLAMQGRNAEAVASFEQAIRQDPQNVAAHSSLLIMLAQVGQPGRAMQHGQRAVELSPNSFELRFNYGILLLSQKRYADGITQLREADKLNPGDSRVAEQIQKAEQLMGRPRK